MPNNLEKIKFYFLISKLNFLESKNYKANYDFNKIVKLCDKKKSCINWRS